MGAFVMRSCCRTGSVFPIDFILRHKEACNGTSRSLYVYIIYMWPCIIYENDERYQLDAKIMIYYHKYLYMFRTSICPSSGVQVVCCCIWCSALAVVAVVLMSRCVLHTVHKTTHRPKHVEIFMIINHNCCIKLVPLVIFIYNARSHINSRRYYTQTTLQIRG